MTKRETGEIIKLLLAYFRNNNDAGAGTMVDAWHAILKDYDYKTVRQAVIEFAKHDKRDYPTMPGVGVIMAQVDAIREKKRKPVNIAFNYAVNGTDYAGLPSEVKELLSEETYYKYRRQEPEDLLIHAKEVRDALWYEMFGFDTEDE